MDGEMQHEYDVKRRFKATSMNRNRRTSLHENLVKILDLRNV